MTPTFGEVPGAEQGQAAVPFCVVVVRVAVDGAIETGDRVFVVPELKQRNAEVVVRLGVVRACGDGATIILGSLRVAGTLADPGGPQFIDYMEDNPANWRSGFIILTFNEGRLLWPEIVSRFDEGVIDFRGELINV